MMGPEKKRPSRLLFPLLLLALLAGPAGAGEKASERRVREALQAVIQSGGAEREAAVREMAALGRPAVSRLLGLLGDPGERAFNAGISVLAAMGEPVVPDLVALLQFNDRHRNDNVAITLSRIGAPAVLPLVRALDSENTGLRYEAARALGTVRQRAEISVPALVSALRDENAAVRQHAAWSLGQFGDSAREAVPALVETLGDDLERDRIQVIDVLSRIDPAVTAGLPRLIEQLDSERGGDRRYAAQIIARLGPTAGETAPRLIALLADDDADVRLAAATALGAIGPETAAEIRPALVTALADENGTVRLAAIRALRLFAPAAPECGPAAASLLREKSYSLRYRGAELLVELGAAATAAVPEIAAALESEAHYTVRRELAAALERIGPAAAAAVPVLTVRLRDDDSIEVRRNAARALGAIARCPETAVPFLILALDDGETLVVRAAAEALGRFGLEARAAEPRLSRWARENPGGDAGRAAAAALERIRGALADEERPAREKGAAAAPQSGWARFRKAHGLIEAGDYETALALLQQNIAESPNAGDIDYSFAWACHCLVQLGRLNEAIEYYEIIVRRFYGVLYEGAGGAHRDWRPFLARLKETIAQSDHRDRERIAARMEELDAEALERHLAAAEAVILRAGRGDESAWEILTNRYGDAVFELIRRGRLVPAPPD